jgi:hypothetical protein
MHPRFGRRDARKLVENSSASTLPIARLDATLPRPTERPPEQHNPLRSDLPASRVAPPERVVNPPGRLVGG